MHWKKKTVLFVPSMVNNVTSFNMESFFFFFFFVLYIEPHDDPIGYHKFEEPIMVLWIPVVVLYNIENYIWFFSQPKVSHRKQL